jgi:Tfp pilus assembly protein PilX
MGQRPFVHNNQRGAVLLLSILIFLVVGMTIVGSMALIGIGHTQSSLTNIRSTQARALAHACAEEALQQISSSIPFSGSGSLTLSTGGCTYTVVKLTGHNREISATGTVNSVLGKVFVTIDTIRPSINMTSWQEVADF